MKQDFIVSFHLRTDANGSEVVGAPFIPLRIEAESAARALEVFAYRSEGRIIEGCHQVDEKIIEAAVNVDHRIYRVLVSDAS